MKITISGPPGSGKSTIATMLADEIGYQHLSSGDFMRQMAKERGMSLAELSRRAETNPKIDKEIDNRQIKLGKEKDNFVIDARLGFYFIPDSLKIFLDVDEDVGAARIYHAGNRSSVEKYSSIDDVKNGIIARAKSERLRYQTYYGVDYMNKSNYDLIIDTNDIKPDEVLDRILNFIRRQA